jgi:tRNA 2-thiouridine synthesizing protein A
MKMSNIVDARGLSCPQPVLVTMDAMKDKKTGQIVILVDTDTSKENVSRAAKTQGWQVTDIQEDGTGFRITINKE